jgi:hypothetical protein
MRRSGKKSAITESLAVSFHTIRTIQNAERPGFVAVARTVKWLAVLIIIGLCTLLLLLLLFELLWPLEFGLCFELEGVLETSKRKSAVPSATPA